MSKKTLALILALTILTLMLLGVALAPLFRQTPKEPSEPTTGEPTVTPTPPAFTTINLSPNPVTITQDGTIEVVIDTGDNELTAVQLEIAYDPAYLTNVTMTPGSFFPDPIELLNTVDDQTGRVTYALGITPAQTPVRGSGAVATITFQKNLSSGPGQTQVDLLPKTLVTQQGVGPSVLKSTSGTTVIIAGEPVSETTPQSTQTTPEGQTIQSQ